MNAVARYIDTLQDHGGLKSTDIANFVDVSSATVQSWKTGADTPQPATQLFFAELHYIVCRLEEYCAPHDVRLWLYAPHPQLDGQRAIDAILHNRAVDVIAILDRLDTEAYL